MADQPSSVDGLSSPIPAPTPAEAPKTPVVPAVRRWKTLLLAGGAVLYGAYVLWALTLISLLPSPTGGLQTLLLLGLASAAFAAIVFLGFGVIGSMRVKESEARADRRRAAYIKIGAAVVPGLLISAAIPFMILGEPPISIDIVSPTNISQLVAPVTMTFSVEQAVSLLGKRGFKAVKYRWDLNADGKMDEETVVPTITATFDKQAIYTVSVVISSSNDSRVAARRFSILQSVFSAVPNPPIVEEPVVFSVASLIDPAQLTQVLWDFDSDGKPDETTTGPEVTYTFFKTGPIKVTATVELLNRTQTTFERTLEVTEPIPLPYPISLITEPKHLISAPPFPILMRVETSEKLGQIQWSFGDGEKAEGDRVTHTYTKKGSFPVSVRARTLSGTLAELSTVVRVVDTLNLPDLTFEGSPKVSGETIEGEVPLSLNIKPRTSASFVSFVWEAPEATEVGSTEESLQAIYRREGTYNVTMVAQDLENHVLRKTFKIVVKPASSLLNIAMDPETGVAPLLVKFDASESYIPDDTITGFEWDFGDNSASQFGAARAEHVYTKPGTYVVKLTIRTTSGKDFDTDKTIVVRAPTVSCLILPSRTSGPAPLGVQFDLNCSSGTASDWLWDFGDTAQSDEESPIHVFDTPGTYTVKVTFTDSLGRSASQNVIITAKP